jgi:hypothetical protein
LWPGTAWSRMDFDWSTLNTTSGMDALSSLRSQGVGPRLRSARGPPVTRPARSSRRLRCWRSRPPLRPVSLNALLGRGSSRNQAPRREAVRRAYGAARGRPGSVHRAPARAGERTRSRATARGETPTGAPRVA